MLPWAASGSRVLASPLSLAQFTFPICCYFVLPQDVVKGGDWGKKWEVGKRRKAWLLWLFILYSSSLRRGRAEAVLASETRETHLQSPKAVCQGLPEAIG